MKKYQHLYGPVPSRRLGRSLGIDLVPHKICTYDCIYCQIGKTTQKTWVREEYISVNEILEEIERFLKEEASSIDYLSLGGSGEPTLHSGIGRLIRGIKAITSIPVAVITNGALFYEQSVRDDLLMADVVLPSMDAVSRDVFEKINRPNPSFSPERMVEGLVEFRKVFNGQIWLEILFCKGVNDHPGELLRMKEAIDQIRPDQIHINTVVRPPSEKWATPLSQKEMEKIKEFFGEKAILIPEFDRHSFVLAGRDMEEEILNILRRRPLSLNDLSKGMDIPVEELESHVQLLIQKRTIKARSFGGSIFYEVEKEIERS
ncbi:MAG: radical SAM protein [Deltaproteobacteria bacterium]|nr:radical SAM protein [Deltaproteobacteria bacterium]